MLRCVPTSGTRQAAAAAAMSSSELKELAALRDAGTISPEEYEQAKAKVLA